MSRRRDMLSDPERAALASLLADVDLPGDAARVVIRDLLECVAVRRIARERQRPRLGGPSRKESDADALRHALEEVGLTPDAYRMRLTRWWKRHHGSTRATANKLFGRSLVSSE